MLLTVHTHIFIYIIGAGSWFVQRKLAVQASVQNEIGLSKQSENISFDSCLLLNISQCKVAEKNKIYVVTVYNPLSQPATHVVSVPSANATYKVYNSEGKNEFPISVCFLFSNLVCHIT